MALKQDRPAPTAGTARPAETRLYLVCGGDEYLVSTQARELVEKLCPPAERAFGLETIEGRVDTVAEAVAVIARCVDALQTVGFLGGRKVVWLKDATFLGSNVLGQSEDVKDRMNRLAGILKAGLSDGQVLVVSAGKVDGRSAFYKACQSAGKVIEHEVPEQAYKQEQQAAGRALQAFREAGLSCAPGVIESFIEKTGCDTRQIVQEVEKLATYLGGRKEVKAADVKAVVSSSREALAWDLADAVGLRDLPGALKTVRQLLFQGENAVGLLYGLEARFRELMVHREAMDRRWLWEAGSANWRKPEWSRAPDADAFFSTLPKDPRQTHPFRTGKLMDQAKAYTRQELERGLAVLVRVHEEMVTGVTPKELQLEFLVMRLVGGEVISSQ